MNMEAVPQKMETRSGESCFRLTLEQNAQTFLGEEYNFINPEIIKKEIDKVSKLEGPIKQDLKTEKGRMATYDRYRKAFAVEGEENINIGDIISARRWGIQITLPEELENFGDGKKVRKLMFESKAKDLLCQNLNKQLALNLSEKTRRQDALTSRAYEKIAERSDTSNKTENKQTGVFAEQIIIGVLESMSINHPDLGFTVLESNAYQDVQDKIDFIISTKQKKRGVGINREKQEDENKTIGIQLTTNTSASEHKGEQIAKAKARGVEVDDIVYIEIKKETLETAIKKWENSGKKIFGPWGYLPEDVKIKTITSLLCGVLDENQEKSLHKIISNK